MGAHHTNGSGHDPATILPGGTGGLAHATGKSARLRPSRDKTDRLMRRVARAQARIARSVADATESRAEMVGEALDTLRTVMHTAESERDRRLAAGDTLTHYRAVGKMAEATAPTTDSRTQVIVTDPSTLKNLLAPTSQRALRDALDEVEGS